MIVSTRLILMLVCAGLIVAVALSFAIASQLSSTVSADSRKRDQSIVFGAIEAGPLAFARLQSAKIAQEQLDELMSNAQIKERGFLSAKIEGGLNFSFTFASWEPSKSSAVCPQTSERFYHFDNAIHAFRVTISTDTCHRLSEEKAIFSYSTTATLLVTFITLTLLGLSLYPVADSIRRAEQAFANEFKDIKQITYEPIRRLIQEAIRKSELEREQALTTMAQQFSHDVRSPLSALNLSIQTLKNIPSEALSVIQASIVRINDISNQLISHRQRIYKNEHLETDLFELIEDLIREKRAELALRPNLILNLECDPKTNPKVPFDRITIARMLSNILNNAANAIKDSGTISIFIRSHKHEVEISVCDNGSGIEPRLLKKLKLGQVSVSNTSGSGMGLSHARRTVERWGGSLVILSKMTTGTIVRITLPRRMPS